MLTAIETSKLSELENIIERNLQTFYDVGNALLQIRDERLYRASYKTFDEYCREKWGIERTYAHRLIESTKVVSNLLPIDNKPTSESVTRPLTSLPQEQQKEAWQEAVNTAPNGKVTAAHVKDVVEKMHPPSRTNPLPRIEERISVMFKIAFDNFLKTVENEKALKWKETSKDVALKYVQILQDVINR